MNAVKIERTFNSRVAANAMRNAALVFGTSAGVTVLQNLTVVDVHGNPWGSKGTQGPARFRCTVEISIPGAPEIDR